MNSIFGNIEGISRDHGTSLDNLETGTKKDGAHYEVPLSVRDTYVQLLNKNQAAKRIIC